SDWSCETGQQRTIAAWIHPRTIDDVHTIWTEGRSGYSGYMRFWVDDDGALRVFCEETASSIGAGAYTADGVIPLGQWTHVAVTYDTTTSPDTGALYINGS